MNASADTARPAPARRPQPRSSSVPMLLVRLKVRLWRNGFRRDPRRRVGLLVSWAAAAGFGVLALVSLPAVVEAATAAQARGIVVLGAAGVFVVWTLGPLIAFGTDETLDPARLVLLPIPLRQLVTGLLVASLVGAAPSVAILTVVGVVIAYAGDGVEAVVITVAGALLLLVSIAASRATVAVLAGALTSRRGRDILAIVGGVVAIGLQALRFLPGRVGGVSDAGLERAGDIVRWTPPGALGQAIVDAAGDRTVAAFAGITYGASATAGLLWAWGRGLDRARTTGTIGSASKARRRVVPRRAARDDAPTVGLLHGPPLPPQPWAAVAARELRYLRREPRRQIQFVISLGLGIGGPIILAVSNVELRPGSVLLSSAVGYIALLNAGNGFGLDGAALWMDAAAGVPTRVLLVGKNVALALSVGPAVTAAALLLAALSGGWVYVPAAVVVALAGLGAGLAVANWSAVHTPIAIPDGASPFASPGAGQGCAKALILMVCLFVQGLLLLPVGISAGLAAAYAPAALFVVAPAAALYGWVVWRVGVRVASRAADVGLAELLVAVHPSAA